MIVNTGLSEYMSKSNLVYAAVKDRIVSGIYHPCEHLVVADVARELKVSPMPVREAFQRLQLEGFIEVVPYVGAKVAKLDIERYKEILLVRTELESLAAKWATPIISDEQIEAIAQITKEMDDFRREGDVKSFSNLDYAFHREFWNNCGNSVLRDINRDLIEKSPYSQSTFVRYPKRMEQSAEEHKQLVKLLRDRDAEGVFEAYKTHKLNSFQDTVSRIGSNC